MVPVDCAELPSQTGMVIFVLLETNQEADDAALELGAPLKVVMIVSYCDQLVVRDALLGGHSIDPLVFQELVGGETRGGALFKAMGEEVDD